MSAVFATGNSQIIVPSEKTALIATELYQVLDTSDVPGGYINILTSKQQDLAEICSGKEEGEVRFKSGNWSEDDGVPYLSDAQANIFCKCYELIEQSSHTIFIGKVFKIVDSNVKKPLIYLDGQYKN